MSAPPPKGEEHWSSKLTDDIVRRMRFFPPGTSLKVIRAEYPFVSLVAIHKVRSGETWKHVQPKSAADAAILVAQGKAEYVRPVG